MNQSTTTQVSLIHQFSEALKTTSPKSYVIGGIPLSIISLSLEFQLSDMMSWLHHQSLFPKVYFKSRDQEEEIATVGELYVTNQIPVFDTSHANSPLFFGGMDFFTKKRKSEIWNGFPECYFFIPLIEIHNRGNKTTMTLNLTPDRNIKEIIGVLNFQDSPFDERIQAPLQRWNNPEYAEWERELEKILGMIRTGSLEKIVISRSTRLQFQHTVNPLAVLKQLEKNVHNSTLFCLQVSKSKSFIGATPELFYQRTGQHIITEAVAGTRPRGKTPKEDLLQRMDLLENIKEQHEFHVVKKYIENLLDSYCSKFYCKDDSRVIQTSTVQHLYLTYEGVLKDNISDCELIRILHPTPATGGMPAKFATEKIYGLESHDRGWYAAPFGWIGAHKTNLFVGIRSALIDQNKVYLFSGAGIVSGSISKNEWKELEYKISQFLKIF